MTLSSIRLSILLISPVLLCALNCQSQKLKPMTTSQQSIFQAVEQNNIHKIKEYIEQKKDLEIRNIKDETPLMSATYKNSLPVVTLLIDAGANVNAQDNILNSPFLYAGASGFTEIVRLCVKNGADYKVYNRFGGSALIPACEKGHIETVIELLKDKKFPINHINNLGWTALLEVMVIGKGGIETQTKITKLLIDAGCDVNIPDKDGVTSLTHARRNGYREIVTMLEKAGGH
ncbi:ankyrin repeat domain-containing protein [Dyadobacter koreensis]|uniref:ankyrin repeat domain-containing protein n=1 Tax=Dyadobacter koreensis TaxID=408657 RepID=UPI0035B66BBA